jgi:hypothetical protein
MERQSVGGRAQGVEMPGSGLNAQGAERQGAALRAQSAAERMRELETENARLKHLVGELLVANQVLREVRDQAAALKR